MTTSVNIDIYDAYCTTIYIYCWSVMHLHFCESRSVHSSAVRPLFCPNKSIWSWKQFCQFCQPRHFTSGVRSITTCSLSSAPQMTNRWIFVCSSANTSILFKAFGCLLLQLAFSTVPSILPVSTMRGTLLAASRRWGGGWVGVAREGFGLSREANILPACYHRLPGFGSTTIKTTHMFCQSCLGTEPAKRVIWKRAKLWNWK